MQSQAYFGTIRHVLDDFFQKTTSRLFSPLLTWPPFFRTWLKVPHTGDLNSSDDSSRWLMPLYLCSLRLTGWGVFQSFCQEPAFSRLLVICCVIRLYMLVLMGLYVWWKNLIPHIRLPEILSHIIRSHTGHQVSWNKKGAVLHLAQDGCFFKNSLKTAQNGMPVYSVLANSNKKAPKGFS